MVAAIQYSDINVVLLAGGQSSRMGIDKALLQREQHTQLTHMLGLLSSLGLKQVLLSRNPQQQDDQLHNSSLQRLADNYPDCGPLSGIEAAIDFSLQTDINAKALLVVPVDLPLLTERTLRYLIAQGQARQQACYFRDHYLPLFLPLSQALKQQVRERLTNKQSLSIKSLCRSIQADALIAPHQDSLFNTNTPQQWQQAGFVLKQSLYIASRG